jgi:ribose-phosphate pyrophosphokinase
MIKLNGHIVEQGSFPDGTLMLKNLNQYLSFGEKAIIEWKYENDAELFALICVRRYLDDFHLRFITLQMDYIPHARQDRIKSCEDVFTLKYFAEVINSLNFSAVNVLDAHSNVSLALIDRVRNYSPAPFIEKAISNIGQTIMIKENEGSTSSLIAFYPDEGAMKRYSDDTKLPYAFGIKKRDWTTGKIQGLDIQNQELVKDKDVLIIDDICSRGGTFYHAAKALKAAGAARIYLYVSHLERTVLEGDLYDEMIRNGLIEGIYTANPLFDLEGNDYITNVGE